MIGIVSHDAGGAEVLSSWVENNPGEYIYSLKGPAIDIFNRKLGDLTVSNHEEIMSNCDSLLASTGWQTDFEKSAINLANSNGIRSSVFLDHWNFYKERFTFQGRVSLPDEIWVGDEKAKELAKENFPNVNIVLKENYYINDLIKLIAEPTPNKLQNLTALYLCDPIVDFAKSFNINMNFWGYDENEALLYFLENLDNLPYQFNEVIIRRHPSEEDSKYAWAKKLNQDISFSNEINLYEDIRRSDFIFGCETMAMAIAYMAGKRVISCIPPKGRRMSLPFEIEYLSNSMNEKN